MTKEDHSRIKSELLTQLNEFVKNWDKENNFTRTQESKNYVNKYIHDLFSEMVFELPMWSDISKN